MYLTYDDYIDMGGNLPITVFRGYAYQAESTVNYYTFDRLTKTRFEEQPERTQMAVKHCIFELIKYSQVADAAVGALNENDADIKVQNKVSESNDGVSVSYNIVSAADTPELVKAKVQSAVNTYLSGCVNNLGYKLLYRGLYPNE